MQFSHPFISCLPRELFFNEFEALWATFLLCVLAAHFELQNIRCYEVIAEICCLSVLNSSFVCYDGFLFICFVRLKRITVKQIVIGR